MGHLFRPAVGTRIGFSHSLSATAITGVVNVDWRAVAWSPTLGLFCAVGQDVAAGNAVMTSPDGVVWTQRNTPAVNVLQAWRAIVWVDSLGLFVAVGIGNARVMTSPDGINWTQQVAATADDWQDIVYASGLGLLVAVANTGVNTAVMTSPDGINWTTQVPAANLLWTGIAYNSDTGMLCAVAGSGGVLVPGFVGRVMTSPNGINWTLRGVPIGTGNPVLSKIAYSPKLLRFVAGADPGLAVDCFRYSTDGITWTVANIPAQNTANAIGDVVWSPDEEMFLALFGNAANHMRMLTSLDGITWYYICTSINTPATDNIWMRACWSPTLSMFVAVAQSAGGTNFVANMVAP